jgi:outer membrane lipoprotein-sorting protein
MKIVFRIMSLVCLLGALAPPASAQKAGDAGAILDRALEAAGGEANLLKFKGIATKFRGTHHDGDEKVPITGAWTSFGPDRMRNVIDEKDEKGKMVRSVTVLNGAQGWTKSGDEKTEDMDADELAEAQQDAYHVWITTLAPLKGAAYRLTALPEAKVGKRAVVGFKVKHKGQKDVHLYFDKETSLLRLLQSTVTDDDGKEVTQEVFFSKYKDVQGTKQPMAITTRVAGDVESVIEISEIRLFEKLNDKVFSKP